jgi:hypothetical protein
VVFEKDKRQRFEASCIEKINAQQYQAKEEKQFDNVPF